MSNYAIYVPKDLKASKAENIKALKLYMESFDCNIIVIFYDIKSTIDKTKILNTNLETPEGDFQGETLDGGIVVKDMDSFLDVDIFEGWSSIFRKYKDLIVKILNSPSAE